ncbi:PfkB family carbohydrate kinase [Alloscardovia macacae]|nr:PfkB family carbohydrate kinase [Alloscardovia macacae]
MSNAKFVYFGQVIVDYSLAIDSLPERGGDIFASRSSINTGGGYNTLYAARKMGARSQYAGALGEGPTADIARQALDEIGVEVTGPRIPSRDTGICIAMTEADGERTFVSTRGAETMLPHDAYEKCEVADDDVVYICGYSFCHEDNTQAVDRFARAHAGREGFTLFDIGPMVADVSDESLEAVALLTPFWSINERESGILCERFGLEQTDDFARRCQLLAHHLQTQVLVRAGKRGAWYGDGRDSDSPDSVRIDTIPTPTVTPVDTNGAGDAHAGVLCAAMLEGMEMLDALKLANCAGALSTEHYGPATCPDRERLEEVAAHL